MHRTFLKTNHIVMYRDRCDSVYIASNPNRPFKCRLVVSHPTLHDAVFAVDAHMMGYHGVLSRDFVFVVLSNFLVSIDISLQGMDCGTGVGRLSRGVCFLFVEQFSLKIRIALSAFYFSLQRFRDTRSGSMSRRPNCLERACVIFRERVGLTGLGYTSNLRCRRTFEGFGGFGGFERFSARGGIRSPKLLKLLGHSRVPRAPEGSKGMKGLKSLVGLRAVSSISGRTGKTHDGNGGVRDPLRLNTVTWEAIVLYRTQ
jgi:hypothetical protein